MTQIDDALSSQTALLNQFSGIIRGLLKLVSTLQADKDAALAQLATLLGVDKAGATAILANNPAIQSLIDEASAALPATPATDSTTTPATDSSAAATSASTTAS